MRQVTAFVACLASAAFGQAVLHDTFDSLGRWTVAHSDGVEANLSLDSDAKGNAASHSLKLSYKFRLGAGYCIAHLPIASALPANYEVSYSIRGEGKPNNLECKLIDGSLHGDKATPEGDDVWWVNTRSLTFPKSWTQISQKKRKFSFAWGTGGGKAPLSSLGAIEFAISAGEGGEGAVWIDDLEIRELPVATLPSKPPVGTASTRMCELHDPSNLFDNDPKTAWECEPNEARPWYSIDFGQSRELGGLTIEWEHGYWPESIKVLLSDDATKWREAASIAGPIDHEHTLVPLPDAQARYVKLEFARREAASAVGIQQISVESPEFGESHTAMLERAAAIYPKGAFPRSFSQQQLYWSVSGVPGDSAEALVSEDGQVELAKKRFLIEPFVRVGDGDAAKLLTWADASITREQVERFLPIPIVTIAYKDLTLRVTAVAEGKAGESAELLCYELTNSGIAAAKGSLLLAVRPLQVLPPWQQLNMAGGAGEISHIAREGNDLLIDDAFRVSFHTAPTNVNLYSFASGPCTPFAAVQPAPISGVTDTGGLASALATFDFSLAPNASKRWWVSMPFHGKDRPARLDTSDKDPDAFFKTLTTNIASGWFKLLVRTRFQVPAEAQPLVETWYAAAADILINQDGSAFQPGSRTYERSWIRDGCLTSSAMLAAGFPEVVRVYVSWYSNYQYDFGKVPCVVDARGADPVDENDSTGEFIYTVMNYYRFTKDEAVLKFQFPRIRKAVEYIEYMRAMRRTPEYAKQDGGTKQEPGKPAVPMHAFYGLVPQSISHEGYSAKPMHSYWDDFFTLRGLKDAVDAANALGETKAAEMWTRSRDEFAADLAASIALTQKTHNIPYIPGCVELGDFDPTSTTIALWPCQIENMLPTEALNTTFGRAWAGFAKRRDDPKFEWDAFTPYELRQAGSLIRLGKKDHAIDQLDWFCKMQRPSGWHQWQEVVWKDERSPKFIGDSPHTWCASDFMNSFRSIFVYERESDNSVVVMGGVPDSWVRDDGVGFQDLPTWYGKLSARVTRARNRYTIDIVGDLKIPAGGIVVTCPSERTISSITVNKVGAQATPRGEIIVRELPAKVIVDTY